METDKQIYQVFRICPDWIFLLTGLDSPGPSTMESVNVKALERRCDGVIIPEDAEKPVTVVEFQFQTDDSIYQRIVTEMAYVQRQRQCPIQGLIFFASKKLDPKTPPWNRIIRSYVLTGLLKKLEKAQPHHPLVAVCKPLLESSERKLEKQAASYYRDIKESDLEKADKDGMLEVLTSWFMQRFRTKDTKEIETMFLGQLPELEETASGKELIRIGEERGMEKGIDFAILLLLEKKFGSVPESIRSKIEDLDLNDAKTALGLIEQWETIDGLEKWLSENGKNGRGE